MFRRLILAVAVCALMNGLRLAADEPKPAAKVNEAERLFRQMEEKLSKAPTIEFVIETKYPKLADRKATLLLAEGNKMRLEGEVMDDGKRFRWLCVSDGTKLVTVNGAGERHENDFPKALNQEVVKVLTYGGGIQALHLHVIDVPYRSDAETRRFADRLRASGFTLGKKEKVNGRAAQVIEYEVSLEGQEGAYCALTVWIDTKTHLPLRHTSSDKKGGELHATETYTKITLGGKIDEKKFKLPK